jgi:Putative MetA-pathway of phenol degradation
MHITLRRRAANIRPRLTRPETACAQQRGSQIIREHQQQEHRASMRRHNLACALLAGGAAVAATPAAAAAPTEESLEDAWWTGPMLAANAATLPQGHMLLEPYLYDLISNGHFDAAGGRHTGPYEHDVGLQGYALYGVTDRLTAGIIPRFSYEEPAGAANSSHIGVGDLTLQAGYGLTQFQPGQRTPAISVVVQETVPTGRYDRLERPSDGLGAGAWTSALALYSQDYFWMPNGRILRARLDLTYALSASVGLRDQSVYGTANGFHGRAYPGAGFTADAAAEYSLTRNWVLALDVLYQRNASTRVSGSLLQGASAEPALLDFQSNSGWSYSIAFAPAIEYNWSSRIGTLLGVRIIEIGRNTAASLTPAVALNMVF